MTDEKKAKKPRTPFEQRSLLRQEKDITAQCESRILKLPVDSQGRVLEDLKRSVADQAIRASKAAIENPIGDL